MTMRLFGGASFNVRCWMFDVRCSASRIRLALRPALCAAALLCALPARAPAQDHSNDADVEPLKAPLAYNGEFVEVTKKNTLRHRYHSYDFLKDLAFYKERAEKSAQGGTPGRIRIQQVVIRRFDIVARHPENAGGKVEATCEIPQSVVDEMAEYEKAFGDIVFAASDGAMRIEWLKPVVIDKEVRCDEAQDMPGGWWFNPKKAMDQLDFLKNYKDNEADFLFFYLGIAKRKDNGQQFYPLYGGMAYGSDEIKGTRFLVLNDHELARGIHEWGHHIFDTTIQETECITVTRGHGLFDAGYNGGSLGWGGNVGTLPLGPCMAYYRDCMRYFYTRDMWRRWRLRPAHGMPREPFSGKPYKWAEVKGDYWFKLPRLQKEELAALTGLKSVAVQAPESCLVFSVDAGEKLDSPRLQGEVLKDAALNNAANFYAESCAVLKTQTGTWLFVQPPLVDVYVDMLRLRRSSQQPLPVYGYVLEGLKALVALRLPDDLPLPADELGFFPVPPVTVAVQGLTAPDANQFRSAAVITLTPEPPAAKIGYTLDGSEPTASSEVYSKPIRIEDTTTLRAAFFDAAGQRITAADLRSTYELCPLSATLQGLATEIDPTLPENAFREKLTVTLAASLAGGRIRVTTDGKEPGADSPVYAQPLELTRDATVRAQYFDEKGRPKGKPWTGTFSNSAYKDDTAAGRVVTIHPYGLPAGSNKFFAMMSIGLKTWQPGTIRYTLDGSAPTAGSAAYAAPIVITNTATIQAALFDKDGRQAGTPSKATYATWRVEKNLTTGKPVTISGNKSETDKPEYVVDGEVNLAHYWGTIPAPQWLQVDLEKTCTLNQAAVFPYWDGGRYYQYNIEVSTDGSAWKQVVDATQNTVVGTEAGYTHTFPPTPARYVKINMLRNSDNPALHLVELRVYAAE